MGSPGSLMLEISEESELWASVSGGTSSSRELVPGKHVGREWKASDELPVYQKFLQAVIEKCAKTGRQRALLIEALPQLFSRNTTVTVQKIQQWLQQRRSTLIKQAISLSFRKESLLGLPGAIGIFHYLQWLDLSENKLTGLPDEIGKLNKLGSLNISNNRFICFPAVVCQFTSLNWLDCAHNSMTELPDHIGLLSELRVLRFQHNHLSTVPKSISQLTQLDSLELNDNRLVQLPNEFQDCVSLGHLDLFNNQLSALPSLSKMTQLRYLDVGGNVSSFTSVRMRQVLWDYTPVTLRWLVQGS